MFQTPEGAWLLIPEKNGTHYFATAEALDQWFENLQNYEATLVCVSYLRFIRSELVFQEEMAAASLDVNFKEELSAIEQCKFLFSRRISDLLYSLSL